jgi:hypothetical protein
MEERAIRCVFAARRTLCRAARTWSGGATSAGVRRALDAPPGVRAPRLLAGVGLVGDDNFARFRGPAGRMGTRTASSLGSRRSTRACKQSKATSREQHPGNVTAPYAPCAEPRHSRSSGTRWATLGRRDTDVSTVSIRFDRQDLPAHAFPKHGAAGGAGVAAGDIVANKLLAGALIHAREQQQLRDEERFAKARYRRERVLIRASANG